MFVCPLKPDLFAGRIGEYFERWRWCRVKHSNRWASDLRKIRLIDGGAVAQLAFMVSSAGPQGSVGFYNQSMVVVAGSERGPILVDSYLYRAVFLLVCSIAQLAIIIAAPGPKCAVCF